jgi:hypothetical protein
MMARRERSSPGTEVPSSRRPTVLRCRSSLLQRPGTVLPRGDHLVAAGLLGHEQRYVGSADQGLPRGVGRIDDGTTGWVPVYVVNLSEDIRGYVEAPEIALTYSWKTLITGHLGRLGTRDDVAVHQQYMADLDASIRSVWATYDPTPIFMKYGANVWAGVKGYLDTVSHLAAQPVIEKYTGVLGAADVFTADVAFWLMESIRLDLGYGSQVHP